jgi:hypothetical protein
MPTVCKNTVGKVQRVTLVENQPKEVGRLTTGVCRG